MIEQVSNTAQVGLAPQNGSRARLSSFAGAMITTFRDSNLLISVAGYYHILRRIAETCSDNAAQRLQSRHKSLYPPICVPSHVARLGGQQLTRRAVFPKTQPDLAGSVQKPERRGVMLALVPEPSALAAA